MSSTHIAIRQTDPDCADCFEILPPDGAVSEGQPEAICVWHVADAVKVRFSGAQPHQPPMGRAGVAWVRVPGLRRWSDQVVECSLHIGPNEAAYLSLQHFISTDVEQPGPSSGWPCATS